MYKEIQTICEHLVTQFDAIPSERKIALEKIADYVRNKSNAGSTARLVYICTHNSRRSHFGQIWAAVAASFYGISNIETYSGGTEVTTFNINAIHALKEMGFTIEPTDNTANPRYNVSFGDIEKVLCFSKVYDDPENPTEGFAAIMTCSDAEENCPYILGCEQRIATSYEDPKKFDGTALQQEKYKERSEQIALECLYVFSQIHK
jgi:protein-tyrosine phosphatase/arsenate reductase